MLTSCLPIIHVIRVLVLYISALVYCGCKLKKMGEVFIPPFSMNLGEKLGRDR